MLCETRIIIPPPGMGVTVLETPTSISWFNPYLTPLALYRYLEASLPSSPRLRGEIYGELYNYLWHGFRLHPRTVSDAIWQKTCSLSLAEIQHARKTFKYEYYP